MKQFIILLTLSLLIFSCNNNAERDETPYSNSDDKIRFLFGSSDSLPLVTGSSARTIDLSGESATWTEIRENKDTAFYVYSRIPRSFVYYETLLDSSVRQYAGGIKPTEPKPDPVSYGTLTWSAGYNSSSEINKDQGMYNSISTEQKTEGDASFRSEVRGNQSSQSSGYRSEMQYNGSAQNPTEGVVEYDVYYENWKAVSGGGHSIQWHPNSGTGSAVLSLQNYGGKFNIVRTLNDNKGNFHQTGTLITTQPNVWYKFRWEVKWSKGSDGYIRCFINGNKYYNFNGRTADDTGTPYLKIGQNRWNMASGQNTIVFYDNVKIYKR